MNLKRLMLVGACVSSIVLPSAALAADPLEINVILPETGPAAFLGKAQSRSIELIQEIVNKSGGIHRRPVKFVVQDDQTKPETAVQLMGPIVASKAPVVIGSAMSATCNAMGPIAKDGPVVYCLSPGVHPPAGSFMFSSGFSTRDLLEVVLRHARDRGWHKVATITSADATGQDADNGIDAAMALPENAVLHLVDREHFSPADVSVAAQIARLKAAEPDVVIAWATGTPFGTVLRDAFNGGLSVPIITTPGNMTYEQMKAYAQFLPSQLLIPTKPAFVLDQLPKGPVRDAVQTFQAAFKAAGIRPDEGYVSLWDASMLIVAAYRKLGTNATAEQIRTYITSQKDWTGVDGVYDFQAIPQRGIGANSVVLVRWDQATASWVGVSALGGKPR